MVRGGGGGGRVGGILNGMAGATVLVIVFLEGNHFTCRP